MQVHADVKPDNILIGARTGKMSKPGAALIIFVCCLADACPSACVWLCLCLCVCVCLCPCLCLSFCRCVCFCVVVVCGAIKVALPSQACHELHPLRAFRQSLALQAGGRARLADFDISIDGSIRTTAASSPRTTLSLTALQLEAQEK